MGLIRKTLSISLTGGLIGYRSRKEKVERNIRQTAKATRQTADASRFQNALIREQNGLIEEQTDAIIRTQQALIAQQAEALRLQDEQLRTMQGNHVPAPATDQDLRLERARQAALRSYDESELQQDAFPAPDPAEDPERQRAREATRERIRAREESWRQQRGR